MEEIETLSGIAQLSLGLVGFTGIVVFLARRPGELKPIEIYRLGLLLANAGGALVLALLALGLYHAGFAGAGLWKLMSATLGFYTLALLAKFFRPTLRFRRETPEIFDDVALLTVAITARAQCDCAGAERGERRVRQLGDLHSWTRLVALTGHVSIRAHPLHSTTGGVDR